MFSTDDPGVPTGWECDDEQLSLFGVKYDPETQRLALPVYSPVGAIRGWVLRQVGGGRGPKVLAVPTLNEPQLGWNPYQSTSADVIVVEDIPSVIRLGEFNVRAVALNGTHLTDEACEELAAEAERVVFALDRDAFRKSVALEQKLRIHFDKTATLLLPKDFKNQTNEEVETCLSEISWLAFSNPEKLSIESVVS
jgi:DNA primase